MSFCLWHELSRNLGVIMRRLKFPLSAHLPHYWKIAKPAATTSMTANSGGQRWLEGDTEDNAYSGDVSLTTNFCTHCSHRLDITATHRMEIRALRGYHPPNKLAFNQTCLHTCANRRLGIPHRNAPLDELINQRRWNCFCWEKLIRSSTYNYAKLPGEEKQWQTWSLIRNRAEI